MACVLQLRQLLAGRTNVLAGPSGAGKSSLALSMMALGAALIADDRVCLIRQEQSIIASAPAPLAGLIEARGIGLLQAKPSAPMPLTCIVDLDRIETDRMPPRRHRYLLGQSVTLLFRVDTPHFPAGLLQYLKAGRYDS